MGKGPERLAATGVQRFLGGRGGWSRTYVRGDVAQVRTVGGDCREVVPERVDRVHVRCTGDRSGYSPCGTGGHSMSALLSPSGTRPDRARPERTRVVPRHAGAGARAFSLDRRTWVLPVEIALACAVMGVVALAGQATWEVALVVIGSSLLVRYWRGRQLLRPGLPRVEQVLRDTSVPFCIGALAVVGGRWSRAELATTLLIALAGAGVALAGALYRRLFPTAQRVVVVGTAVGVAEAATRWASSRHVELVGSLVVDGSQPAVPRPRQNEAAHGAPIARVADASEIDPRALLRPRPDMVVVVPGAGLDAERLRRIGWALEGTGTALAVQSDLDGIAPHRLEPTEYAGANLLHVASSRPAWLPQLVKTAGDRVFGALLLLLASPLLLGLMLAVRATSDGPAIFRQVRVGAGGREFTMFKLRTMVVEAEDVKSDLKALNEGAGVLFKLQHDPRITPIGRILRKLSLDELPQLVNVVLGDMSLVGPRPALPSEVEQYSSLERRRLAVKPGITGLWQVSGRSDLSWDESVRLDNHYTENWRLADDAVILFRTVDAVVRSRGAY